MFWISNIILTIRFKYMQWIVNAFADWISLSGTIHTSRRLPPTPWRYFYILSVGKIQLILIPSPSKLTTSFMDDPEVESLDQCSDQTRRKLNEKYYCILWANFMFQYMDNSLGIKENIETCRLWTANSDCLKYIYINWFFGRFEDTKRTFQN